MSSRAGTGLALALCAVAAAASGAGITAPANIAIVFGDDVGYGDLSCFGHPTSRTPNLDRLAREGSKLVQYLSAANICSPSRASLSELTRASRAVGHLTLLSSGPSGDGGRALMCTRLLAE